jgi:hypothetical protein
VSSGGTVSVPSTGTSNISATGGPAVEVNGTPGITLALDDVDSTNSATNGISLSGLGAGTFSANSGDIGGASGTSFSVSGGTGAITYPGALNNGPGQAASITNRTGGVVSVSGNILDTNDTGGGITVSSNSGGSTVFSGATKQLNTGSGTAVLFNGSDGHTLAFSGGGLDIDTTSGKGIDAQGLNLSTPHNTLQITGSGNTIDSGSGRALGVVNTDVNANPLTFDHISSNGAASGILLNGTGPNNALTVTGTGGTCTSAITSGCTGGEIANGTGADDPGNTPPGTGVVLNNTKGVSLTRMHIHDHSNYGIRGNSVNGLTFSNSVIDGTNGTSVLTSDRDSSMRFTELTGTVSMTNVDVAGGLFSNLEIINTAGTLNATLDAFHSLAMNQNLGASNAVTVEGTGTSTMNLTYQNGSVTSARGQMFHYIGDGTGGGTLTLANNNLLNGNPLSNQSTGGGGISAVAGAKGPATLNITNNNITGSKTNALTVMKSRDISGGSGSVTGTIGGNHIGVAATANSGSSEGDGLEVTNEGHGNMTLAVTSNDIRQYNSSGIQFVAGGGIADGGQLNLNVSGNSIGNPGTNPSITLLQGIRIDSGVDSGDTFQTCANFGANAITGSSDAANKDFRLVVNDNTTIRLPGYAGGATDTAAVVAFVAGKIGGGAQGTALANSPGTFTGTGTTCP